MKRRAARNEETAVGQGKVLLAEIRTLMAEAQAKVDATEKDLDRNPKNWGIVGDLGRMAKYLRDLLGKCERCKGTGKVTVCIPGRDERDAAAWHRMGCNACAGTGIES